MRTLEEINKGCAECTLPEIMLCSKCRAEHKKALNKELKYGFSYKRI